MSTLLFHHKKKEKIFFSLKGIVFPERRSGIISVQILGSKAFKANDTNPSIHRYTTIEFKSKK